MAGGGCKRVQDANDPEARATLERLARPQNPAALAIAERTLADLIPKPLLTTVPDEAHDFAPQPVAQRFGTTPRRLVSTLSTRMIPRHCAGCRRP